MVQKSILKLDKDPATISSSKQVLVEENPYVSISDSILEENFKFSMLEKSDKEF